jgi:hypothetical protein
MIHLTTFHNAIMGRAAELCISSAAANGVDSHSRYTPANILHCANMHEYTAQMERMFEQERGCGYWSWKPLIIKTDMDLLDDGDILVYADAGVEFIASAKRIVALMRQDIFLFGNNYLHAHWCKRDIVDEVWTPMANWWSFDKQVQASVIFIRVSDYAKQVVAEWLYWCLFEGGRLLDDSPSRAPNHPEFQENRHDQAILTTIAYREGINLHWWPAKYGNGFYARNGFPDEGYPALFHHHRLRDHEWGKR